MAAYVLIAHVEIRHLLTAVIMTAPATLMLAKMLMPEIGQPATAGGVKIEVEKPGVNIIDAAARGASDGLHLALNIGAMLIAFHRADRAGERDPARRYTTYTHIGWLPGSMQAILGRMFRSHRVAAGRAAGTIARRSAICWATRLILNEFVAFVDLGKIGITLDPQSFVIATYALCGFANLSSVAIQVGGIGALAPTRKSDLARLGMKAVAAGTMANFMSACIAGMLL